ncbi:MAG: GspH/FimT family pseudopilin [Burkholderiales bacterium]|nr:GspH/FimT family pseudopilin [Burkholderiales bacterium]
MRQLNAGRCGRRAARGLTLIEMMVAVAIGALLLGFAAPFFGDYIRNSRLREAGNLLLTEALAAQSEAIKRNTTVRLETAGATVQVIDRTDPNAPVVLRERTLPGEVNAAAATLDFGSEGRPTPFGSSAAIDLGLPGFTCSSDLRCPGLRIDAGGATRLCGNHQHSCV